MTLPQAGESQALRLQVPAKAQQSTLHLSSGERAMGAMVNIPVARENETMTTAVTLGEASADLAADSFWQLYKRQPEFRGDIPESREVNRRLLEWASDGTQYKRAREATVGNLPAARNSAGLMHSLLTASDAVKQAMEKQAEANDHERTRRELQNIRRGLELAGGDSPSMQGQIEAVTKQAEQARSAALTAIDKALDDPTAQAEIMAAMREAADKAQETIDTMVGFGLGPGDPEYNDPQAAEEFAEIANDPVVARIAKLAGRVKGAALDARRGNVQKGVVIGNVKYSRDMTRLLASERALLRKDAPSLIRAQKVAAYCNGGLLAYETEASGTKQGPFVGAVDCSPSMMWGGRHIVAKAIAWGLAQVAKADGREYILFGFASDANSITTVTSRDGWKAHAEWARLSIRGGTDFEMAVRHAVDEIAALQADATQCDLVFISDGEGRVNEATQKEWELYADMTGARLLYVPVSRVDKEHDYYNMREIADEVWDVRDLDDSKGLEMARTIGSTI